MVRHRAAQREPLRAAQVAQAVAQQAPRMAVVVRVAQAVARAERVALEASRIKTRERLMAAA